MHWLGCGHGRGQLRPPPQPPPPRPPPLQAVKPRAAPSAGPARSGGLPASYQFTPALRFPGERRADAQPGRQSPLLPEAGSAPAPHRGDSGSGTCVATNPATSQPRVITRQHPANEKPPGAREAAGGDTTAWGTVRIPHAIPSGGACPQRNLQRDGACPSIFCTRTRHTCMEGSSCAPGRHPSRLLFSMSPGRELCPRLWQPWEKRACQGAANPRTAPLSNFARIPNGCVTSRKTKLHAGSANPCTASAIPSQSGSEDHAQLAGPCPGPRVSPALTPPAPLSSPASRVSASLQDSLAKQARFPPCSILSLHSSPCPAAPRAPPALCSFPYPPDRPLSWLPKA